MTSISELNQEEDEVLAEDPDLTAADVTNATGPLPDAIAVLQREKEQVHAITIFSWREAVTSDDTRGAPRSSDKPSKTTRPAYD